MPSSMRSHCMYGHQQWNRIIVTLIQIWIIIINHIHTKQCYYCYYIQRIVTMSISKRRAQKSLNHSSLSEVSHSENLRECCLFKNNALAEIQNAQLGSQSKSSRKDPLWESNSAKKRMFNPSQSKKENQPSSKENQKSKENRALNYTGLSKMMDERNGTIEAQGKQIDNLRGTLDKVRKELELTRIDFEKRKLEDLATLKRQERDNEQNIKELQILRVGMKQLKNRVEALQLEKAQLQKKSTEYFKQNQQLTIKLTSLKQEYIEKLPNEQTLSTLKHELEVMKQQAKLNKELQLQKTALDQRCRSFERKINEYILKYNEIQSEHNEMQIKYYRAQKDNDDTKIQLHQLQAQNRSLERMLEEERKSMAEIADKWKSRISKLEERGDGRSTTTLEQRIGMVDLEQRCAKLQRLTHVEQELQICSQQKIALQSKLVQAQTSISNLTIELNAVNHKLSQSQVESNTILQTCQLKIRTLEQKLMICDGQIKNGDAQGLKLWSQIQRERTKLQQTERKLMEMEGRLKESVEIGLGQVREIDELEIIRSQQKQQYCRQIQNMEQTILDKQRQLQIMMDKLKKISLDLHNTMELLKLRSKHAEEMEQKYQSASEGLIAKQSEITILTTQLKLSQSSLAQNQQQYSLSERSLQEKLTISQKLVLDLQNTNQAYIREVNAKNDEIYRLEGVVSKVNSQLKDIKVIVHGYKVQINKCNEAIVQQDRKLENQAFLSKESDLKYQEQLKYFKDKYDQSFKHGVSLSSKICSLQQELTEQLNKCTEQARINSSLELRLQKCTQQRNDTQTKLFEQIRRLQDQSFGHQDQTEKTSMILNTLKLRVSELESLNRTLETNLIVLEEKSKAQKKDHIQQIVQLNASHAKQISQHQHENEALSSVNLSLQLKTAKLQQDLSQLIHKNKQQANQIESRAGELQQVRLQLQNKNDTLIQTQLKLQCVIKQKSLMESEQLVRTKEYNYKLVQQAEQNAVQFNKNCAQLREQAQLAHKYRAMINGLEKESNELRNRNIELVAEIQRGRERSRVDIQDKEKNITALRSQIITHEEKIRLQNMEISAWVQKHEICDRQLKKAQSQCNRMGRSFIEEGTRKNKQNLREVEANRAQIKLLQEQNMNLQKIMDKQLNKRKAIIEELIHEKKLLYQQIGRH